MKDLLRWVNDIERELKYVHGSSHVDNALMFLDEMESTILEYYEEIQNADMINSPSHYKLDGLDIESKEVIKAVLGPMGYVHWACGNAMKYLFRWEKKNGLEDLKKARKNLDFAIETLESGDVL